VLGRLFGHGESPRADAQVARIGPWLLVGPALTREGYRQLAADGVTHVLELRSEDSDDPEQMRELNLAWRHVPIDDRDAPTHDQLTEIVDWLGSRTAGAGDALPVLYVHCQGGLGRSPTIAIALLMRRGFTRTEAYRLVLAARPVAFPTEAQEAWLNDLDAS
jgi:protein-tyrosine phosphatase